MRIPRVVPLLAACVALAACAGSVAAATPPKVRQGPSNLDLLGIWIVAPGTGIEPMRILFEHQAAPDPKCLMVIDVQTAFVREPCRLVRAGDQIAIHGSATRVGKAKRAVDELRLTKVASDRLHGSWSAAPGAEIELVIQGSSAEKALAAPDPAQIAAAEHARQQQALSRLTDLIQVPAGSFEMGSTWMQAPFSPSERPRHRVDVANLEIGRAPVTFAQWDPCVDDGACYRPDDLGWGRGAMPVINVNVADIQAYLQWLSAKTGRHFRLPTEAEWEYVARAQTTSARWWGERATGNHANCIGCGSSYDGKQTSPVGAFAANPFGLDDVLGDVWQIVADCWHDSYRGAPAAAVVWADGADCDKRVVRGGSWNRSADFARAGKRVWLPADARYNDVGFRVVAEAP